MAKSLEELAVENGATEKCLVCDKLQFPVTFCSGCGMYAKEGSCVCNEEES